MNQITADKVGRYRVAFQESLKATADSGLSWGRRKAIANTCAAEISPDVDEAISVVMNWRRHTKAKAPNAAIPLNSGEYYLINRALAWKTKQKKKYDNPNTGNVTPVLAHPPAPPTVNDENTTPADIHFKKGYICDWYEQWFQENDKIFAQDKELASALGCSPGAFTFARNKMRENGYEIEKANGSWRVTARPVDERKQEQIAELTDYLDNLAREVAEAKEKLATLGV